MREERREKREGEIGGWRDIGFTTGRLEDGSSQERIGEWWSLPTSWYEIKKKVREK